jgi:glycine betaine/proline transport system ATP-binding protein
MTDQVTCKNLWKIYGARADEALLAIRERGLGKDEARQQFNCIIGVQDASFEVSEGEIFCIMGLSGSGKSTLVRHINRLIEPTAGEVIVNGRSISDLDDKALRQLRSQTIGMVFQHMALWPHRTIRENVAFGLEIRGIDKAQRSRTADQALEMVQLSGWEGHYPDELSGGMQQRVGLARALAVDPEILLMDEPFSALDPLIRRQLQDQFLELSKVMKKTTLFITHDLGEAIRLGNRIAIMNHGKIVQIGTPEEIVTNPKDEYVADFVEGISRLQLVYAHTVMQPIEAYNATHGNDLNNAPRVPANADLNQLIDVVVDTEQPLVVIDDERPIGVITKRAILRAIQGREQESV